MDRNQPARTDVVEAGCLAARAVSRSSELLKGMAERTGLEKFAGRAGASEDAGPTPLPADVHALLVSLLAEALVLDYQDDVDTRCDAADAEGYDTDPDSA
jgi:hypothetical protein